jgi:PAS domain S-box-containing protein
MQNGVITYINPSGAAMFGLHDVNQILGKSIYSFILPEYRRSVLEKARGFNHISPERMREIGKIEFPDLKARRVDGEIIDVEARGIMMSDQGTPSILVVGRDVTRQRQTEEMMRQLAYHDVVTGLPNRRLFEERLNRSLLLANRSRTKVAVMFIDLDRFKLINDTLSHSVGDLCA